MSQDLLTQLAEYGSYHEERQGATDAEAILGTVVPLPVVTDPPPNRRGLLVGLAVAAVLLLVIGLPLLLSRSEDSPPATTPETATTTTLESSPPTTVAGLSNDPGESITDAFAPGWAWDIFPSAQNGWWHVGRLASGDALWIVSQGWPDTCRVVGGSTVECDTANPRDGEIPLSDEVRVEVVAPDGTSTLVVVDGAGYLNGDGGMHGGVWIADGGPDGGEGDALWLTGDGMTWDRRPLDPALLERFDGGAHTLNHGDAIFADDTVIMYAPHDGRNLPIIASAGVGEPFEIVFEMPGDVLNRSVNLWQRDDVIYALIDDDGRLETPGEIVSGGGDGPSLWSSRDGFSWEYVGGTMGLPSSTQKRSPRVVKALDEWIVAVWGESPSSVARSSDGITWLPVEPRYASTNSPVRLSVADWSDELAYEGWLIFATETDGSHYVVSRDGSDWYRLPPLADATGGPSPVMFIGDQVGYAVSPVN